MYIFLAFLVLIIGFALLWKSSNLLIDGAASIAHHFKVPELIIGLTLLAFGTSVPEVVVNIFATIKGKGDIVFGNIIGSNIANILLILGICGFVVSFCVKKETVKKEVPFSLLCTVAAGLLIFFSPFHKNEFLGLNFIDSLVLLAIFSFFIIITFLSSKNKPTEIIEETTPGLSINKSILFALAGIILIPISGKLVIESSIFIARNVGISEALISLTAIAFGTSLPELITCVAAALKNKTEMIIGNVMGSLIFNTLFALGISGLIKPIAFNPALILDYKLLLISNTLIIVFLLTGKRYKLNKLESGILVLLYVSYIIFIGFRG
jgi:cation:H+ antiporter